MGVTIRCQRTQRSIDVGYSHFYHLRTLIAQKMDEKFGEHYAKVLHLSDDEYEEYDRKTEEWIKKPGISIAVADFLYQPDCEGKASHQACWRIYKLVKDEDDNAIVGYPGWSNPARMGDFKKILLECNKYKCCMEWN